MFWLEEAGLEITGANIARAMQLSPPTVHEMIGRFADDGYVERAADKSLDFTEKGRGEAEAVVRRHRLIERFLTDVLGIPWDEVHEEAERLEHAMSPCWRSGCSPRSETPRPAPTATRSSRAPASRAPCSPTSSPGRASTILRFENEAEELLHYLKEAGLVPCWRERSRARTTTRSSSHPRTASTGLPQRRGDRLGGADPAPPPRAPLPEQLVLRATATAADHARRLLRLLADPNWTARDYPLPVFHLYSRSACNARLPVRYLGESGA